jgi:protein involved in polysaccharide export with SLBB domain
MIMRILFLILFWVQLCFADTYIDREILQSESSSQLELKNTYDVDVEKYKIKPGDLLLISVKQDSKLDGGYRVAADGQITFPLIGQVAAENKSPLLLEQEIANRLAQDFIRNPQVMVFVKEYTLPKIHLVGEFIKPGMYSIADNVSLLEALEVGGGPSKYADMSKIELVRGADKRAAKSEFYDYHLIKSGEMKVPELDGEDTVIIKKLEPILVEGGVNKPGRVYVNAATKLSQIIHLAGGFSEMADISDIHLSSLNKETKWINTAYDFNRSLAGKEAEPALEPGQKVYVGVCDKKIKFFGKLFCVKNQTPIKQNQ